MLSAGPARQQQIAAHATRMRIDDTLGERTSESGVEGVPPLREYLGAVFHGPAVCGATIIPGI